MLQRTRRANYCTSQRDLFGRQLLNLTYFLLDDSRKKLITASTTSHSSENDEPDENKFHSPQRSVNSSRRTRSRSRGRSGRRTRSRSRGRSGRRSRSRSRSRSNRPNSSLGSSHLESFKAASSSMFDLAARSKPERWNPTVGEATKELKTCFQAYKPKRGK